MTIGVELSGLGAHRPATLRDGEGSVIVQSQTARPGKALGETRDEVPIIQGKSRPRMGQRNDILYQAETLLKQFSVTGTLRR